MRGSIRRARDWGRTPPRRERRRRMGRSYAASTPEPSRRRGTSLGCEAGSSFSASIGWTRRRRADAEANTPTRVLPANRAELATRRLYPGLIRAGVETFWRIYEHGLGDIAGLAPRSGSRPFVVETYPRYVIRRLWPELKIPSKTKAPTEFVAVLNQRLRKKGYMWREDVPLRPDHVDAMLCAIAAEAHLGDDGLPKGTVGVEPTANETERMLREGLIVSP